MCVALNVADPIWIPLTATINTYIHEQTAAASSWTVTHNLGEENVIVQVYDDANQMVIPDTVTPSSTHELVVTFGTAVSGRVMVMYSDTIPTNGIGVIDPFASNFLFTLSNPNPTGTALNDEFGNAVDMSASYALVGAYKEDDANTESGKAYIFSTSTGSLLQTLDNPNPVGTTADDNFGFAVGVSESYAIVGAPHEDDANASSGKAYIFNPSTGALLQTLDNPSPVAPSTFDLFGSAVDVSTTHAVVGAYEEDDGSGNTSGKVYIYNPANGSLLNTIDNPNPIDTSEDDQFGRFLAVSPTYLIASAAKEDSAIGEDDSSGAVYVFNVSTAALLHTKTNPNTSLVGADGVFGEALAITDTYFAVGTTFETGNDGSGSGVVYVYDTVSGSLLYTITNPNAFSTDSSDRFGSSVSLTDTHLIVGATGEDETLDINSGKAYIFLLSDGSLLETIDNRNLYGTATSDEFGNAVAISGNNFMVAAHFEDDESGLNAGKAYLYSLV